MTEFWTGLVETGKDCPSGRTDTCWPEGAAQRNRFRSKRQLCLYIKHNLAPSRDHKPPPLLGSCPLTSHLSGHACKSHNRRWFDLSIGE
jgi:hypothetical protein